MEGWVTFFKYCQRVKDFKFLLMSESVIIFDISIEQSIYSVLVFRKFSTFHNWIFEMLDHKFGLEPWIDSQPQSALGIFLSVRVYGISKWDSTKSCEPPQVTVVLQHMRTDRLPVFYFPQYDVFSWRRLARHKSKHTCQSMQWICFTIKIVYMCYDEEGGG